MMRTRTMRRLPQGREAADVALPQWETVRRMTTMRTRRRTRRIHHWRDVGGVLQARGVLLEVLRGVVGLLEVLRGVVAPPGVEGLLGEGVLRVGEVEVPPGVILLLTPLQDHGQRRTWHWICPKREGRPRQRQLPRVEVEQGLLDVLVGR